MNQRLYDAMHRTLVGASDFSRINTASMSVNGKNNLAAHIRSGGRIEIVISLLGAAPFIATVLVDKDGVRTEAGRHEFKR